MSIKKITPENICAASTILFPFFFLSKRKVLLDYMFVLGIISGALSVLNPTSALTNRPLEFDTIRFYICHTIIAVAPLLMVVFKVHELDYKRIFKVPFILYGVLGLILINDVIQLGAGFSYDGFEGLIDRNINNASFIYGPTEEFDPIVKYITFLTPKVFLTYPLGENAGQTYYWPILWMVVPVFFFLTILGLLLALPFEYKHIKSDIKRFFGFIYSKIRN